jgi:hypothetical protein
MPETAASGPELLRLEGGRGQSVIVQRHPTEHELLMAVLDRAGDAAAVSLTRDGAERLRDALTIWLQS